MKNLKSIRWIGTFAGMVLLLTGCVSTAPYVRSGVGNTVDLKGSDAHAFKYVRVSQDGDELVIYGKVFHNHKQCIDEGHVDMTVVDPSGDISYRRELVLGRGSNRVRGWHGAAFRGRLHVSPNASDVIQLRFHGEKCVTTEVVACNDFSLSPTMVSNPKPGYAKPWDFIHSGSGSIN